MHAAEIGARIMDLSLASVVRRLQYVFRRTAAVNLKRIPQVDLCDLIGKPVIRVDGSYSYVDGSLPWNDIVALMSLLVDRSPRSVVEVGTFNGYTTRLMSLNLPDAEIHTIDLPENYGDDGKGMPKDDWHLISARRVGSQYRADPSVKNVRQHFGDTAQLVFPPAEAFFIDGSHTYAYARNDTEKALASPEARLLVWHDCNMDHPGVTRWLTEMIHSGYPVRHIRGTNLATLDLPRRDTSTSAQLSRQAID